MYFCDFCGAEFENRVGQCPFCGNHTVEDIDVDDAVENGFFEEDEYINEDNPQDDF